MQRIGKSGSNFIKLYSREFEHNGYEATLYGNITNLNAINSFEYIEHVKNLKHDWLIKKLGSKYGFVFEKKDPLSHYLLTSNLLYNMNDSGIGFFYQFTTHIQPSIDCSFLSPKNIFDKKINQFVISKSKLISLEYLMEIEAKKDELNSYKFYTNKYSNNIKNLFFNDLKK